MVMLARMLVILVVALGGGVTSRVLPGDARLITTAPFAAESIRSNPRQLRAAQWLGESREGSGRAGRSKVRFEWDQVPGARAYLLRGRWTGEESWAVRAAEHRVTPRNATWWGTQRVAFDVTLVPGSHSWRVVALRGPDDAGDFENATRLAFEVR